MIKHMHEALEVKLASGLIPELVQSRTYLLKNQYKPKNW